MKINNRESLYSSFLIIMLGISCASAGAQEGNHLTSNADPYTLVVGPDPQPVAHGAPNTPMGAIELASLVEALESEHGPFDYRLSEPLLSAGEYLEEQGEPFQALRFYERALHVTRINDGLYSETQIGIVERLINCNISLENWQVVDNHFRYLHLLYTRLYEENSPELSHGLARISDWHVLALNNDLGTDRLDHLREANKLFRKRLEMAGDSPAASDPEVAVLRHNIAVTQYHLRIASGGGSDSVFDRVEDQYRDQLAVLD